MESEDVKKHEGKKVFLKTTFGRFYTIDVHEVDNECLRGTDKFNQPIDLSFCDITSIVPISGTQKKC